MVKVNVPMIKELAEKKNMTIKDLESKASIANGAIAKWNTCDAGIDKLYRVADALGTKVNNLIEKV